jgi:hypothetical protein
MPRELIEPRGDKRYVRRGKKGQFSSRQVDVGRSLSADRRSKAKTVVKKGEGNRGDRRSDSFFPSPVRRLILSAACPCETIR